MVDVDDLSIESLRAILKTREETQSVEYEYLNPYGSWVLLIPDCIIFKHIQNKKLLFSHKRENPWYLVEDETRDLIIIREKED